MCLTKVIFINLFYYSNYFCLVITCPHKDIWLYAMSVIEAGQIQYSKNTLEYLYIGISVLGAQRINELLPNNRSLFLVGIPFSLHSAIRLQLSTFIEVGILNQIASWSFWFWWVFLSLRAKISNFQAILVCPQGFKQNLRIRWNFNTQIWFFDTVNDYGFQSV